MLSDMLKTFVTEPDFDKGFRYSHKILSHHQLEETNEYLRRQLAATLISIKHPRRGNTGGLLDVPFVNDCVVKKVNAFGEEADDLSEACRTAKRGDSILTERTERVQHRVNKLISWLEWLKVPAAPMAGELGCGNPNCPCSCSNSNSQAGLYSSSKRNSAGTVRPAQAQTSIDPHKAADEAMQQLLLEGKFSFMHGTTVA